MTIPFDNSRRFGEVSEELRAYLKQISLPERDELVALRERTAKLPFFAMMQGPPSVSQLLQFLIGLVGARQVLEVGVFTGCSTLAMATVLPPDGRIVAIDVNEEWSSIGREYWKKSGCDDRIDLRIGAADDVLNDLLKEGLAGTFDLAFIDANKDGYEGYFERCLILLRDNGVMVFDNVLFGGRVHRGDEADPRQDAPLLPKALQATHLRYTEALRQFNERMAHDQRVDLVVLPMEDGVTLARKKPAMPAAAERRENDA
jgi:predicted O-methyltransferase YrrM